MSSVLCKLRANSAPIWEGCF